MVSNTVRSHRYRLSQNSPASAATANSDSRKRDAV